MSIAAVIRNEVKAGTLHPSGGKDGSERRHIGGAHQSRRAWGTLRGLQGRVVLYLCATFSHLYADGLEVPAPLSRC